MRPNSEMPARPYLTPGDDMSHELRPGDGLMMVNKKPPRPTLPPHTSRPEVHTNIWPQQHSGTTNSHLDQVSIELCKFNYFCHVTLKVLYVYSKV